MDSAVQLALMSKAKKVFGAENTFLSFPIAALPYDQRQLDFYTEHGAEDARQNLQNLQEFSTLVNLIPSNETWVPGESKFLWETYAQILKEANFATSTRTPQEEIEYQKALSFLRTANQEGIWEDSVPVKTYKQYKDAYLVAQQAYLAAKMTAECLTNPDEQKKWRDVDEIHHRENLDTLQAQWVIAGYKNEVENAQNTVMNLGARSPIQTWNNWQNHFNTDIDSQTAATNNFTYFPSFFAPSNALQEGAWKPFKLSEEEITSIINEVPLEQRSQFSSDGKTKIKSISFEFSSATIIRPWFTSDIFRARFWRFPDTNKFVSDGCNPPTGSCPAYVAAVIFARKVLVEEKPIEHEQGDAKPLDGYLFSTVVAPELFVQKKHTTDILKAAIEPSDKLTTVADSNPDWLVRNTHKESVKLAVDPNIFQTQSVEALVKQPMAFQLRTDVSSTRQVHAAALSSVTQNLAVTRASNETVLRDLSVHNDPIPLVTQVRPNVLIKRQSAVFTRLPEMMNQENSTVISQSPVQNDKIYILAFVCKVLPKCPDPDTTLQW